MLEWLAGGGRSVLWKTCFSFCFLVVTRLTISVVLALLFWCSRK